MVAGRTPSILAALIVKRTVVLPGNTVAALTYSMETPYACRSVVWTEAGSTGSLKVTSKVNGPGIVKVPPAGGLVETTCSRTASYRNVAANCPTGRPSP